MKSNRIVSIAVMMLVLAGLTSCKSSGMAMTSHGQLFKININAPDRLANNGEGTVEIVLSNRGVTNVQNIIADVEIPSEIGVVAQTNGPGITASRSKTGTPQNPAIYHFTLDNLHPGEDAHIRFKVRGSFGAKASGQVSVTAWQKDLPGEKLFSKTTIGREM
jgi:hypothetical protein